MSWEGRFLGPRSLVLHVESISWNFITQSLAPAQSFRPIRGSCLAAGPGSRELSLHSAVRINKGFNRILLSNGFGYVIKDDETHQHDQQKESHLHDPLLHLHAQVTPYN